MTARLGPGSTFAAYRIESVVGRGGMGVVYQATDLSLGRPVALKLIAPELADASLIVQRTAGIVAEPLLAPPGRGVLALADGAGLLVVGFSERWRQEGLGKVRAALVKAPPAPTVLVRRGPRPGGLAPPETVTRFGWSLTS